MNCPYCAHPTTPEAQKCPQCGRSLFLTAVTTATPGAAAAETATQAAAKVSRTAWVAFGIVLVVVAGLTLPFLLNCLGS